MTSKLAWILLASAVALAIAALLVASGRHRPQAPQATGRVTAGDPVQAATTGETATTRVELYFPGANGRLVRESREIPAAADASIFATRIVEALLAGPRSRGAFPPFPPDVTVDEAYLVPDGTAYVDLRSSVSPQPPSKGSTAELLALYSLVNSVVENVPGARSLVVLWNSRQPRTFGGHIDTSRPLLPAPELGAS